MQRIADWLDRDNSGVTDHVAFASRGFESTKQHSTSRAAPRESLLAVGERQAQAAGVNVLIACHSVTRRAWLPIRVSRDC
jgi:hypothetical protein